jgi:hypothetical protein
MPTAMYYTKHMSVFTDTKFDKGYQANCVWKLLLMFSSGIETIV